MQKGILFMLHISFAVGSVIVTPQNVAVVAGDWMSMECRTDVESRVRRWDLTRVDGETITIYSHGNPGSYHQNYTHFGAEVNANGSGILFTNSTRIGDAGLYTCVIREGPTEKPVLASAWLIVFESLPICKTNLTDGNKSLVMGDHIWFQCSVAFRGFWTPTMEWRKHSGNGDMGIIISNGVEIERLPNKSVNSSLTIEVDSSMNGFFFSCKTHFAEYDGKAFNSTASNIPDFSSTWSSSVIALSNFPVPETATGATYETASSSDRALLAAGLSVFLILLAILAVVSGIRYKEKIIGRSRRVRPDVVQHEDFNMSGNLYATYVEIPFDQPEQCNVERRQLSEAHEFQPGHNSVYAEVMKVKKQKPSGRDYELDAGPEAEIRQLSKTYYTGADGTQYIDVNKLRGGNSRVPVKYPPMFSLVETYASIDHTLIGTPPPLLPARTQRSQDLKDQNSSNRSVIFDSQ